MDVEDPENLGDAELPIVDGEYHTATAPESFGLGLTDGNCTMTFLEANVAITTRDCANVSKRVDVGSSGSKFRTRHEVIDANRNASHLVAMTLKSPVKLAGKPFGRRVDPTPVAQGETITCYGYTGGKVRSGPFEVGDSAGTYLSLRGLWTTQGIAKVDFEDLGGYCVRDGAFDPVAILVSPTNSSGYASAARLLPLERGVRGAVKLGEAAPHGAIRLADASFKDVITAEIGTADVTFASIGSTDDRRQAFYRVQLSGGGGTTAVELVDVATGECLTRDGGRLEIQACGNAGQTFEEHWQLVNGTGFYGYEEHGSGEAMDMSTSPMLTTPWAATPEQQFLMGLTFF
ncbi:MAG: hypothetical protein R3B72_10540 [Polyangiaceae bacterium]